MSKASMAQDLIELLDKWNKDGDIKIKEMETIDEIAELAIPTIALTVSIINRRKKK